MVCTDIGRFVAIDEENGLVAMAAIVHRREESINGVNTKIL
jgi:hypothetical protein